MATIFDGRKFAAEKEMTLQLRVLGLKTRGVYPKLASILVGNDPASELYVNLKKKAAERIGAEVDIYLIKEKSKVEDLILLIKTLNEDTTVHGIMIQMPLPEGEIRSAKSEILNAIDPEKDVDGLREDGPFLHPTSKAVMEILDEAKKASGPEGLRPGGIEKKVVVVGGSGMVGRPLVKELRKASGPEGLRPWRVTECDTKTPDLKEKTLQADILVSVTGVPAIIKCDMVKAGAIVIDVGSPKGDVEPSVGLTAGFFTPVPGGVGPVTITCLLENLLVNL